MPLLLSALVLVVYWQVCGFGFVNFDDDVYVSENPRVLAGLTWESVAWTFTTFHGENWYPLTWLSYMADVDLFGPGAAWHHRVNVGLHLANTVLLFMVLRRMTAAVWPSAWAAALFGVHPLHVESVAWIAERKDVLSGLFWMLTMAAYVRYARRPSLGRYMAVAGVFALGLMSKPMLVTLPFALVLLDWWPLGRLGPASASPREMAARLGRLVWEKLPLLALSAVSSGVTYLAQTSGGATELVANLTFGARVANAVVSYGVLMGKTVWPTALGVFYPHPVSTGTAIPAWQIAASLTLLVGVTLVVLRQGRRRPFLAVGWLWFLGTLVPVSGLIQTGAHSTADRFAYLPSIGLFVALAWGVPSLLPAWRGRQAALAACGAATVLALAAAAHVQTSYWRDSVTLWTRAIAVTDKNWLALNNLGDTYYRLGQPDKALGYFREALRIRPDYVDALHNLGVCHQALGQQAEAIPYLEKTAQLDPGYRDLWRDLGHAYFSTGRHRDAIGAYTEHLKTRPGDVEAWNLLGVSHGMLGQYEQAIGCFREVLRLNPDYPSARDNLALASARLRAGR